MSVSYRVHYLGRAISKADTGERNQDAFNPHAPLQFGERFPQVVERLPQFL
jgi:hypothetical protein